MSVLDSISKNLVRAFLGIFMNYIVLDLEWNQGQHKQEEKEVPTFEIIEIGAIKLNEKMQMTDTYQSLVKPQIYATMHRVTAELVNLRMADLKDARPFKQVAEEFLDWCGEDSIFCIWGVQDLTEWQKNMDYYGMYPLSRGPIKYYDVQKLYSLHEEDGKTRVALSSVVEAQGMVEEEVPFHRAFGDAYYTARILQRIANEDLMKMVSFDTYHIPASKKDQILWKFDNYTKFISQGYDERSKIMENKNITCIRCNYCEKALRKKMPWFTPNNGKHYYTVAKCSEHGLMKGKIRIRRSKDDKYYVVKTIKHVTEEEAAQVLMKKKHSANI